jgi:endonuclease/exonuclease/phosphatase family metal-dependent hydrolase
MKYLSLSLLALLLSVLGFYFWGSSSLYEEESYHQLKSYPAAPKAYHPGDTLQVITYNIGFLSGMDNNLPVEQNAALYRQNMQDAKALIRSLQADFIGFQEIDFASARSLDMQMMDSLALAGGYLSGVQAVNWDKRYVPFPYGLPAVNYGRMLSGQAILSRFPISHAGRLQLSKPEAAPFYYKAFYLDRLLQTAFIPLGPDTLVLLNVHLEAFDTETREQQAQHVLAEVEKLLPHYPLLLIGDFNARPTYASEQLYDEKTMGLFMEAEGLQSAITKAQYLADEKGHFTFDTENPVEQLDYIFYSKGKIRPIAARVLTEAGQISDHFPVAFSFVISSDSARIARK